MVLVPSRSLSSLSRWLGIRTVSSTMIEAGVIAEKTCAESPILARVCVEIFLSFQESMNEKRETRKKSRAIRYDEFFFPPQRYVRAIRRFECG